MNLVYQYKLQPSKANLEALGFCLFQDRMLYNCALQERCEAYRKEGKSITAYDQQKSLTEIRADDDWWRSGHVARQRGALRRLDKAYKAFFRRVKAGQQAGFPRFKGRHYWNSIDIESQYSIKGSRFHSKDFPGGLKFKRHRDLPADLVKHCGATIKRNARGWWLNLRIELPDTPAVPIQSETGLDMGLAAFYTDSEGNKADCPKHYREGQRKLRVLSRKLARAKRGSNGRARARQAVARQHLKVANRRRDFHHQTASRLLERHDRVVVEDLRVANMVKNPHLSKSISDAGWGQFIGILSYKAAKAGKEVARVDARGTSQACSGCGVVVEKSLSVRVHDCPDCGLTLDRDHNAAINILNRHGIGRVARSRAVGPRLAA